MTVYPINGTRQLEFSEIRSRTSEFCTGHLAKEHILMQKSYEDIDSIELDWAIIHDVKLIHDEGLKLSVHSYIDNSECYEKLEIENIVLEREHIAAIFKNIYSVLAVQNAMKSLGQKYEKQFIHIRDQIDQFTGHPELLKDIARVLGEDGEVLSSASPELFRLRKSIEKIENNLDATFSKILKQYKKDGYLSEVPESVKFGRRVLSLPAENKRRIEGQIQAQSSTGKTVFMEPAEVMRLNNQIADLKTDEQNEIYRILRELCAKIAPHRLDLENDQKLLAKLDAYIAKAILAAKMGGNKPHLQHSSSFKYISAYHPLLKLFYKESESEPVPFNMYLDENNRILLLSGPNAGGKTVTLKAIGLLQLMIQHAYLIPVHPDSTCGIFDDLFVEMGDQQSIENELSTYSSRLRSMKHILSNSNPNSLVLIDEFGSGTDPRVGGAIAEAMIEALLNSQCISVITTHYDNLKKFALKNKHIVNASMLFDMKHIRPTYRLNIGKPGSSYGLEMASRMGIPNALIQRAKNLLGSEYIKIEDFISAIEKEATAAENLRIELENKKKKLDTLVKQYEQMFADFEIKRKKLKVEARELEAQKNAAQKMALQEFMKKMDREKKQDSELNRLTKEVNRREKAIKKDIIDSRNEYKEELTKLSGTEGRFKVGDHVKLKLGDTRGTIVDFQKDHIAWVDTGLFRMEVKIDELVKVGEPIERKKKSVITQNAGIPSLFNRKLDIRGFKVKDAEKVLDSFFDKALLSSDSELIILHGKGSGALRKSVWNKAKSYNFKKIMHEEEARGGEGVTVIQI